MQDVDRHLLQRRLLLTRARPIPVFATLALGPAAASAAPGLEGALASRAPAAAAYGATYSTSCICTFCQICCKTVSGTFNSGTCC